MKQASQARLMRIHLTKQDRWQDRPLYEVIVERCHDMGAAGAIVYKGIEGYGANNRLEKDSFVNSDAPIIVTIVDTSQSIDHLLNALDGLLKNTLVAVSDVDVWHYSNTNTQLSPGDSSI